MYHRRRKNERKKEGRKEGRKEGKKEGRKKKLIREFTLRSKSI
jgi:flagellar biosynthesis/type III secretory pathway protein FliH